MKQILIAVFLVGVVAANYGDIEQYRRSLILEAFSDAVSEDKNANKTSFKNAMKKLCDDLGEPESYQKFETSLEEFRSCVKDVLTANPKPETKVANEILLYGCKVAPEIGNCMYVLAQKTETCIPTEKRDNAQKLKDMVNSFISYGCDNNAEKLTNLFAEEGYSCIESKMPQLQPCLSDDQEDESLESLDKVSEMQEADCKLIADLRKCLKDVLVTCPQQTAANFVEGLFDVLYKFTICVPPVDGEIPNIVIIEPMKPSTPS